AFMAGLKAAAAAPTWPGINGAIVPTEIFANGSFLHNLTYNKIGVHFIHRTLANIIGLFVFLWWYYSRAVTSSPAFNKAKNVTLAVVAAQILLGICTVLASPKITAGKFGTFEWLALIHQLTGMMLLLSLVSVIFISGKRQKTF
ncbi:MAG TPA: COX15/CtaA family protein, partial [Segetibacter sp.]